MFGAGCARNSGDRLAEVARLDQAGEPFAVERLEAAAKDGDAAVRALAIAVLARTGDERTTAVALRALDDASPAVRASAARALGETRARDSAPALAARVRRDRSWEVRRRSVEALGALGGDVAGGALRDAMLDPDAEVRAAAVRALAEVDPGGSVRACLFVLATDAVWQVRVEAAILLSLARTDEARAALREAKNSDPNAFVRAAAFRGVTP